MGRKSKKKEEVFHVEVITQARVVPTSSSPDDARWEYYVKWATYPDSENSWEPEKNLKAGCARLLASFWQHVGLDNEDYQVGYVAKAKEDWIESEKAFFKAEFDKVLEKEKNEKKSKKRKRGTSREVTESASTVSQDKAASKEKSPQEIPSDSDDDRPLKESASNLKIRIPKKVVHSPEPETNPASPRPRKIQKRSSVDFNANDNVEDLKSPPHSPPRSPASLFSDPSSPETTLSSKILPKVRTTSLSAFKTTSRITNPQARIASMPISELTVNSGITTKQRIAKGALDPTNPKELPAIKQPSKPLPGRGNSSLMHLNFKKHTIPTSIPLTTIDTGRTEPVTAPGLRSPMVNDPTLAALNSPSAESPHILSNAFSSIAQPDAAPNVQVATQHFTQPRQTIEQVDAISPTLISPPHLLAAEDFLQGIMPVSMAGPLKPAPDIIQEPMPPKPLLSKAALPLPRRIQKLWKWTGQLHLNSAEQPLCDVKIHNLTRENGLNFSIAFQQIEKIQVSCLYNTADFGANLGVFRNPTQLALLSPDRRKDTQPFNVLARFLGQIKKFFLMSIILDNNCTGQVLFFPYIHHLSILGKDLPPSFNQPDSLVAAVAPYALSPMHLKAGTVKSSNHIETREKLDRPELPKLLRVPNLDFQHGLRILGFSDELFLYMKNSAPGRSFCVWSERPRRKTPDMETRLLTRILEKTRAPHVAYNAEARLIFVHAGALSTLYKLPRFAERRSLHNHVQFYVYGTDTDISPKVWPVQEIYPCGGIVTFTPLAIRNDPIGVLELIRKINAHPIWESYILSSVLGLLVKLEWGHNDPLTSENLKKPLMMDIILEAIADGKVSLLEAPPETPTVTRLELEDKKQEIEYLDDNLKWIKEYFAFSPPQKSTALNIGISAFVANKQLSKADGSHCITLMDEAITKSMTLMQRKPVFMSNYRRYVVIESDTHPPRQGQYVQGLEWTPLKKFDFNDAFYPKQSL